MSSGDLYGSSLPYAPTEGYSRGGDTEERRSRIDIDNVLSSWNNFLVSSYPGRIPDELNLLKFMENHPSRRGKGVIRFDGDTRNNTDYVKNRMRNRGKERLSPHDLEVLLTATMIQTVFDDLKYNMYRLAAYAGVSNIDYRVIREYILYHKFLTPYVRKLRRYVEDVAPFEVKGKMYHLRTATFAIGMGKGYDLHYAKLLDEIIHQYDTLGRKVTNSRGEYKTPEPASFTKFDKSRGY